MKKKILFLFSFLGMFLLLSPNVSAFQGGEEDIVGKLNLLVVQLGVIVIAAWGCGRIFEKMKLPSVLGEIIAGMIIGPFSLGALAIPGFETGLFPVASASFPVTIELYSFATIASIILLFFIGLETDMEKFIQFSVPGFVIGFFGVAVSFILGDWVGILYSEHILGTKYSFFNPLCLFFGVISTATSVGISARILSDKDKMSSPVGVTILSAAVIDDILGLVILAAVVGMTQHNDFSIQSFSITAARSIAVWVAFTALGLVFAFQISGFLKKLKDGSTIALISLALALILAGIFEKSGLAMIIGAYTMGITLSKTDISFLIQEKIGVLQAFFVPIFFCVMGMMIDLKLLFSPHILLFGFIYIILAVVGKFIGCSLPALFCNFNKRGAMIIGTGMVPRGEVALIVAGIGLSKGIINEEAFSIAVIMTFFTTLIVPPILSKMFDSDEPVLRKNFPPKTDLITLHFEMPNPDTAEFIHRKILDAFRREGFHTHRQKHGVYFIRRKKVFITMFYSRHFMKIRCLQSDEAFIHVLLYEVITELERFRGTLQMFKNKQDISKKIFEPKSYSKMNKLNVFRYVMPFGVSVNLQGKDKKSILNELINLAGDSVSLKKDVLKEARAVVFERESSTSTAMQDGIALPHGKLESLDRMVMVMGLKKEGVSCNALDGKPSSIFILILIPKNHQEEYVEYLAKITTFLSDEKHRKDILAAKSNKSLYQFLEKF